MQTEAADGVHVQVFEVSPHLISVPVYLNPLRTAVPFWGQFGTNYLELDWWVPKTGLEF